ncbi:N-acetylmuramoyl-L-alanine amidase [Corynebacterium mastitidis]|uniref:N-acetylmuramoyl-L-alanine amidase n=1 Tax=Corynebacterium mastitidis TaxID=161890 RepID=UPI002550EE80|nr:N-acetylmuramoyl-L-alanine amidase [Corynebacterium mastitidis]MDK8450273.1 N-acetylmuramoyl-L-alanine amidase [Corynebacterium mastitidis]
MMNIYTSPARNTLRRTTTVPQRRRLIAPPRKPVLAAVLSAALVATATLGVGTGIIPTDVAGATPVAASEATASFASGSNVVVDDPAIATQGEGEAARTVKEFSRDEQFSMFALTWNGTRDIAAFVRAQAADGSWGPWYNAEPLDETSPSGTTGTELIYVEPTNRVQVSVSGVDVLGENQGPEAENAGATTPETAPETAQEGQAPQSAQPEAPSASPADTQEAPAPAANPELTGQNGQTAPKGGGVPLPTNYGDIKPVAEVSDADDIEAVFIDGNAQDGGIQLAAESDSYGMPEVVSRAGWGADESIRCQDPTVDDQVSALTIHHTAGSNNYTQAQAPGVVRGIYQYHAQTLGWCDIGYNALVDKFGTIYEGRYGGLNEAVQGAHAGGFNQNTWGISMMGNYETVTPPQATLEAVGRLAGWRAALAGFDPTGEDIHYSEGTSYTKYAYGTEVTLPNIFAHRDVGLTTCPGDAGYAQMDTIREIAKETYDSLEDKLSGEEAETSEPTVAEPDAAGTGTQGQATGVLPATQQEANASGETQQAGTANL